MKHPGRQQPFTDAQEFGDAAVQTTQIAEQFPHCVIDDPLHGGKHQAHSCKIGVVFGGAGLYALISRQAPVLPPGVSAVA
ncbi:hypothetical protein GCM10007053_15180 [Halioglobus pacificus]|uniref:Uncharacterized protein n=1 Tax=Parahalioglobus pacificus TaxID=930806 RepID=A0A918XI37_9GAMM|nr:hypothetical protein GCM10007053_15180 [Halioglobus pacificus]